MSQSEGKSSRRRRKVAALALDTSDLVLSTLKDAARLAPIPYLQQSATLALGIVNVIQGVRNNKDAFLRLTKDACELVYVVLCTPGSANPTSTYLDHLRELTDTLGGIQQFAKKEASRTIFMRIIRHKADLDTITEYRGKLRQSLDVFGLKSSISIEENVRRIEQMVIKMTEQKLHHDEAFAREEAERKALEKERRDNELERMEVAHEGRDSGTDLTADTVHEGHITREWELGSNSETPPPSAHDPFHRYQNPSPFNGGNFTTVAGSQNPYTNSVVNSNSGNTTTSAVSNSNNDSSVRIGRSPKGRGKQR
ncbi:hypothetical protein FPV67DRAFT_874241 [Lyophyllum atratum]|nr:hypothetical protein FPV67DRAFT_874241 [Lyophyllum atratum]